MVRYSIIIPVYNRPNEVDELLESLTKQTYTAFEVLIVEDGSEEGQRCDQIVAKYDDQLDAHYYYKPNAGQGPARNFGYGKAQGDYFIVFDSDCVIPPQYLEKVDNHLMSHPLDAFGGPDSAHADFTIVQRAISYAMTSPLTTGGIRGGKKHVGTFHPRSFNMGISRKVFEETGGFLFIRMGEDIEFSLRMIKAGFTTGLIEEAYVYHKRRTNLSQFFKQIYNFGRTRIYIGRAHPGGIKLVHMLPAVFTLGFLTLCFMPLVSKLLFFIGGGLLSLYFLLIFLDALRKEKNLAVAFLSIIASFIQLFGYGIGFLREAFIAVFYKRKLLRP